MHNLKKRSHCEQHSVVNRMCDNLQLKFVSALAKRQKAEIIRIQEKFTKPSEGLLMLRCRRQGINKLVDSANRPQPQFDIDLCQS